MECTHASTDAVPASWLVCRQQGSLWRCFLRVQDVCKFCTLLPEDLEPQEVHCSILSTKWQHSTTVTSALARKCQHASQKSEVTSLCKVSYLPHKPRDSPCAPAKPPMGSDRCHPLFTGQAQDTQGTQPLILSRTSLLACRTVVLNMLVADPSYLIITLWFITIAMK